jgi:hypothetical protein
MMIRLVTLENIKNTSLFGHNSQTRFTNNIVYKNSTTITTNKKSQTFIKLEFGIFYIRNY